MNAGTTTAHTQAQPIASWTMCDRNTSLETVNVHYTSRDWRKKLGRKHTICTFSSRMMSSNGNIFRVTGLFVRGIHRPPVDSPPKSQWRGALMLSVICTWTNGWANNRDADDFRRHRAHYDVTVILGVSYIQEQMADKKVATDLSEFKTTFERQNPDPVSQNKQQGKSEGFDSCDRSNSNLTQIGFKSSIFQPVWPWNLMDDLEKL